ncbi:hypothetical protein C8Q79DRAFT_967827 [Trametes meyenii]|nr:hypothetical protein C8Q79DRAFT_967827 [Trametes meyenii]
MPLNRVASRRNSNKEAGPTDGESKLCVLLAEVWRSGFVSPAALHCQQCRSHPSASRHLL